MLIGRIKYAQRKDRHDKQKKSSIPVEYTWNIDKVNEYLEITSRIHPSTIHFSMSPEVRIKYDVFR